MTLRKIYQYYRIRSASREKTVPLSVQITPFASSANWALPSMIIEFKENVFEAGNRSYQ